MESRCNGVMFRHRNLGNLRTEITMSVRYPKRGPSLPFLKIELPVSSRKDLINTPETDRLEWNIVERDGLQLWGLYEDPMDPWVVLECNQEMMKWVSRVRLCGIWVLEVSCGNYSALGIFENQKGIRIEIEKSEEFINDFSNTFIKEKKWQRVDRM